MEADPAVWGNMAREQTAVKHLEGNMRLVLEADQAVEVEPFLEDNTVPELVAAPVLQGNLSQE